MISRREMLHGVIIVVLQITVPGSLREFVVKNLQPTTLYDFQLIANGPNGVSDTAGLKSLNSGISDLP